MNNEIVDIKSSVIEYCTAIGNDPMLIQGAGGNISWKEKDTLWVKASGTWLADAPEQNIFIPVDLLSIQSATASGNFEASPKIKNKSTLRPSIETLLHAIMPHRVVVHLHAIEILVHLLGGALDPDIAAQLDDSIRWILVNYHKPGALLAKAIYSEIEQNSNVNVVFLKNHGVVIGGDSIAEVDKLLKILLRNFSTEPCNLVDIKPPVKSLLIDNSKYFPIDDIATHQIAINSELFKRLEHNWALYPDHLIFLGSRAEMFWSLDELKMKLSGMSNKPKLVFVLGVGVFSQQNFTITKQAQLRCYYDILSRLSKSCTVSSLNNDQIAELLNWDAERYRMGIEKK